MLRILHPQLDNLECDLCKEYQHNLETGQPTISPVSKKLVKRVANAKLPCDNGLCPKGHWQRPHSLSQRNRRAYAYHLRCRTTGHWPSDEVVLDNATIIAAAEDKAKRLLAWQTQTQNRNFIELLLGTQRANASS